MPPCLTTEASPCSLGLCGEAVLQLRVTVEVCFDSPKKFGHFRCRDIPNEIDVDAKVFVDENVAQTGDSRPFDSADFLARRLGKLFRSLANDFEVPNDGIDRFFVRTESSFVSPEV